MHENSKWQHYFVRDTIYTLINWIYIVETSEEILISLCYFLISFVKKIVSDFPAAFGPLLTTTVNCLKYLYKTQEPVKQICLELMNFLIVENSCILMDAIEKLDNLPNVTEFDKIRTVHSKIKYGNSETNLDKEIEFFLHQDNSTTLDILIHLRISLSKQKHILKHLCDKLEDKRGLICRRL